MLNRKLSVLLFVALSVYLFPSHAQAKLVEEEVNLLREVAITMGAKLWKFNAENCTIEQVGLSAEPPDKAEQSIGCVCGNFSDCHVASIIIKYHNLNGVLPPQLSKFPYLTHIDFAYNYLNGSIPREWSSMNLSFISLTVNRLSGEIPMELGNISSLTYLNVEANQLSGTIPPELGKLANLQSFILSSNMLSGTLPLSLGQLSKMNDFRINDNNFSGKIPKYIGNWRNLQRLEMHGSGLEGPIPENINLLNNLQQLRISDIRGPPQYFPLLSDMNNLTNLVLRSCNLVGEIPAYIWKIDSLLMVDLSFNELVGEIPSDVTGKHLTFVFLTGNKLGGDIPSSLLKDGTSVDLSYNNFTFQDADHPTCTKGLNMNVNAYRSSSFLNTLSRPRVPCMTADACPQYSRCLYVDCGGTSPTVTEFRHNFLGDGNVYGGAATYYLDSKNLWGFSSTGDYMDDNDFQNTMYVDHVDSPSLSPLYSSARRAPITLSYFHRCLENGKYNITLHFAELKFTNDETYKSLGKRVFDIYVQDTLVKKDFNILDEIRRVETPFPLQINGVNVSNNFLEIRLYFAGKGTTRIPDRGVYGPIISGISLVTASRGCSPKEGRRAVYIIIGVVVGAALCAAMVVATLWWRIFRKKKTSKKTVDNSGLPTGNFSLKQIKAATNDFSSENKIGEGGFGPVYKGTLSDGTVVAVKQLSSKSSQGNREFLNEIAMISCLKHPNLVKLHGFCVEGDQLLLVYEYMENNSLARALFGHDGHKLHLDWPTRHKICIGIARGLAFLHEESRLKIVHRDIKATNVLLDERLNPKISDFGLARLNEEEKSHISTRIAGTIGYMAPEYALWGYLTHKVDVYSFGVVALELVSGRNNSDCMPSHNCFCLLDRACYLQQNGDLIDIVDESLKSKVVEEEALKMVKVALVCTNISPTLRPTMSEVVAMLEGEMEVPDVVPSAMNYEEDVRFKALRELKKTEHSEQCTTRSMTEDSRISYTTISSLDHALLADRSRVSEQASG